MNFLVVSGLLGYVSVVCGTRGVDHAAPTLLEDIIMPGVRGSYRHTDTSVVFPTSGVDSGYPPGNGVDVVLPQVLPVFPTGDPRGDDFEVVRPQVLPVFPGGEDQEDYVELPEWMDVDLDKISMDKLSMLSGATNLTELASLFGLTKDQQDKLDKESKFEDEENDLGLRFGNVIGNSIEPNVAICKPELEVVELEAPPSTVYLPQCVRLQRCGGCCTGNLLSCQPTKTEVVTLKVMKLQKNYGNRRVSSRRQRFRRGARASYSLVSQVNHLSCSCQCSVQEHHCDKNIQDYKAAECACLCKNRDEEPKCIMKSTHFWDRRSCSCKCRKIQECSTGEEFSKDSCSCVRRSSNSIVVGGLESRIPDSKLGRPCPQCALDGSPICGSDGRTYINHCDLAGRNCENTQDRVTVLHLGSCGRKSRNFPITSDLEFLPRITPSRRRNKPIRVPLQ